MQPKNGTVGDQDNPLLESCSNLFSLTVPLATGDRGEKLTDDYREKILSAFAELEREGFEKQLASNDVNEAKYALAAYIDERVLSSSWHGKTDWMGRPLQLEFFGDHLAGEGFYEHLKKLRQAGERNLAILEVYYVCLQMGFEGMYRMRGSEQLLALQVDVRSQINDYRGRPTREISPHGVPDIGLLETVGREVPYWVIGIVTVSVLFFGYIGFAYTLDSRTEGTRSFLQAKHEELIASATKIKRQVNWEAARQAIEDQNKSSKENTTSTPMRSPAENI